MVGWITRTPPLMVGSPKLLLPELGCLNPSHGWITRIPLTCHFNPIFLICRVILIPLTCCFNPNPSYKKKRKTKKKGDPIGRPAAPARATPAFPSNAIPYLHPHMTPFIPHLFRSRSERARAFFRGGKVISGSRRGKERRPLKSSGRPLAYV